MVNQRVLGDLAYDIAKSLIHLQRSLGMFSNDHKKTSAARLCKKEDPQENY